MPDWQYRARPRPGALPTWWPLRHPRWFYVACVAVGGTFGALLAALPGRAKGPVLIVFLVLVIGAACVMAGRTLWLEYRKPHS